MSTKIKRASCPALDEILGDVINVQNHGHVRVIDYMGNENAIVQAARVSYGDGTKTVNEDKGLIRYLLRHKHTTPFEMCVVKLHLKMPIFVARQWVRHRMSSMNEYSARYSEMRDEFFFPKAGEILGQSTTNKQGSDGELSNEVIETFISNTKLMAENSYDEYKDHLDMGVSRELARINLPLSVYTEFYWKIDLHNLMHFLKLRCDSHAQKQIRDYADPILELLKVWLPNVHAAFTDYIKDSVSLSKQEYDIVKAILDLKKVSIDWSRLQEDGFSKREAKEFCDKFGFILVTEKP